MQSKQHMAICPTHAQTCNLLIKTQQKCTLVCPNCILNSPNLSRYSLDTSTLKPFGLLVTEQSKMYFEQWTKQLIVYFHLLVQENDFHFKIINVVSIMPSVGIWREQLPKLMKTALLQQIKIFQGNLGYVRRFNASQLTNQIFLADLYSMAVQFPELSLEIILDRFKAMARQSPSLGSIYWQIQKLTFSQQFVLNVQKIKGEVIKRCQTNFIINIESQKRRNGQVSIINIKQQKEGKTEKQNQIQSEYEGQGTDDQNQIMRVSQIVQRKQVVGHQGQQGNSNRKLKVIGHKSLKASWEEKEAHKDMQYCTPSRMKQKQNYFHKLQVQKGLVQGQGRTIPSTEKSRNNNSKYSTPDNTKTVKSQHLVNHKEVPQFGNSSGTHNCTENNCQKCTNFIVSPIQRIVIELEDQNKKLLKLKRQLGEQIQSMRSKISEAYTFSHSSLENVNQKDEPKIYQLQAKVGYLQARVNQLVTNKAEMEQQLSELKRHCSIKEDLSKLLEQKIQAMQKERNEMVTKMNNSSQKYKNELNQRNKEFLFKLEQLEKQNNKLNIRIKQLEQQIMRWKQSENVSLQREMKLQYQLNEINEINTKFIEQISVKNKLIEQLEKCNNEQVKQQLIDAEGYIEIERQKSEHLTARIQELQNQNRQLYKQNEELNIRIKEQDDLVKMIDQLKVVLAEKQIIISSTNKNFIELQTKCVNYQNSLEAIISSLKEKQNHIKNLSEKMVSIEKQLQQCKDIQAKYMGKLQAKQTLIESKPKVELELSFEKFINQQLSQSTHDLSQKLKKIEMQLALEKKNNDVFVVNLNSQNAILSQKIQSLLQQNEGLKAEKEAMASKLSQSQKDVINLNTNLSQLTNKLQQLKQYEGRLKQYETLIDEKSSLNQNLTLQLQIETKKTIQLQNIIQSLVSQQKEKQNELKILKQQVIKKTEMIEQQGKQLMDMHKQYEGTCQRQLQSKQYLERMVSKCQQLQQTISLYSQRVSELEHQAQRASGASGAKGVEEEMERSKVQLQKKIVYLQEKARHLEQELKKQSDYDEQLMQQLIECESKLKSKHFEADKLAALCQQLMSQIDVEKRVRYEQMMTKIKPNRLKTQ